MRTRAIFFYMLAALFISAGCGTSYRVFHDADPAAEFDRYATYDFLDWTDGNKESITGMERERIRVAVARGLEEAGLSYEAGGADLKVKITVYFREASDHYYHYPTTYHYIERAIALDVFEADTRKHIWHSAIVGEVEQDPQLRTEELPELVARLMAHYPGKKNI